MGYNKNNYKRIREEYETKYLVARQKAERHRAEIHALIPEILEIDRELSLTGLSVVHAAMIGDDVNARIEEVKDHNLELQRRRAVLLAANGYPADYTEVKYECPLCGDTGFIDIHMCACMKKKLVEAGYESSGMGNLIHTQTFENFSLDYYRGSAEEYRTMTRVRDIIKQYAENFAVGKSASLFLYGNTGLGKTHLSSAVAKTVIDRGYDVFYVTALSMISDFEYSRFGNDTGDETGSDTSRYFDCDLLIIDDLGTEVINKFTTATLYNIINRRLTSGRATIINTNLTQDEFRKQYWDRITSRVFGEYVCLPFLGSDIRRQKLQK